MNSNINKKKNFKNYVVVSNCNLKNYINLELNYLKNNSILIRNFKISTENIKTLLNKLEKQFNIFYENENFDDNNNNYLTDKIENDSIKNIEQITNSSNYLLKNMNFNSYKNSFNQNFYNNYLKND